MRLDTCETTAVVTGSDSEPTEFQLKDINLFISMYRDKIYKNKLRVIPQEYLANARDAHREVGEERPVEVTLPTELDPCLRIRDYGPGMDDERIKVFTTYGDSTKRGSDEETGGFGIGCKCAWSNYDSFTVKTIFPRGKRNLCREYHMYLDGPMSAGLCRPVQECYTTEACGTEIIIPVKDAEIEAICNSVRAATTFWKTQPIVDEEQTKSGFDEFEVEDKTDDYVLLRKRPEIFGLRTSNGWVIVDGICYPLDKDVLIEGRTFYEDQPDGTVQERHYSIGSKHFKQIDSGRLAFLFKTGEVSINPNREELEYDAKTIAALKERIETFGERAYGIITKLIEDAPTAFESMRRIRENSIFKDGLDNELEAHGFKIFKLYEALKGRGYFKVTMGLNHNDKKICKREMEDGHVFKEKGTCAVFCYQTKRTASYIVNRMKDTDAPEVLGVDNVLVFWEEDERYHDDETKQLERQIEFRKLITHTNYRVPKGKNLFSTFVSVGFYLLDDKFEKITPDHMQQILDEKRVFFCRTDRRCAIFENGKEWSRSFMERLIRWFKKYCGGYHEIVFLTTPGFKRLKKENVGIEMFEDHLGMLYEQVLHRHGAHMLLNTDGITNHYEYDEHLDDLLEAATAYNAPLQVKMDLKFLIRMKKDNQDHYSPVVDALKSLGHNHFPESIIKEEKANRVIARINRRYPLLKHLDFFNRWHYNKNTKRKVADYIRLIELSVRVTNEQREGEQHG